MIKKLIKTKPCFCLRFEANAVLHHQNTKCRQYPISLDMLLLLPRHLRYGECEGGFAVCVAGVAYPYEPSLREVGGSIFGILQAGCWCKKAEKDVPLAM